MASRRPVSPVEDLMGSIMNLIAEPYLANTVNSRRRPDSTYNQHPVKVINHDYCEVCKGNGPLVFCNKCPKSYHEICHIPKIDKQPDGDWFCRSCTGYDNAEIIDAKPNDHSEAVLRLQALYEYTNICTESFMKEYPIKHKYNDKLPSQKQLDKQKMIRKRDKCYLCKQGILKGRLVNCHYCKLLYHINCLYIPIRHWDRGMRWMCPEHRDFFEVSYPEKYTPDAGKLTSDISKKRLQYEIPESPKDNTFFNVPSHIDAMYKTPEKNIPTPSTDYSSFNILCDVASFALQSMQLEDCEHNVNGDNNISNDICVKFLSTSQNIGTLENNNNLQLKQPYATLSFLSSSTPLIIPIKKKSFTIGKNVNNNLYLPDLCDCECVSDYHATITFDDELGDYLVTNHSRHGFIVDNVSYIGCPNPSDSSSSETDLIDSEGLQFKRKRRKFGKFHGVYHRHPKNNKDKLKKNKMGYKRGECICSNRFIPKGGYNGDAVLHSGSIILIGCLKFEFSCDIHAKEVSKCYTEKLAIKNYGTGNKQTKALNGLRLKPQSEQENCINVTKCTRNELALVTINRHCSLDDTVDTNSFNEQNNISLFDLDNSEDCSSSKEKTKIYGTSKNIIMHNNNFEPSLDINLPETLYTRHLNNSNDLLLNKCFASDLIQEVDVLSNNGEIIEEEIVYAMHIPETEISTPDRLNDVQDWIFEEIVEEDKNFNNNNLEHSVGLQLTSALEYSVPDHNHGDYKTEHLYCARSPSYNETIIISDDDE